MALVLADRVQQTGTANTTVSFTLSGSVTGFRTFAAANMVNNDTTYYGATDTSGNWEVGVGTYSTTGPTLTRTTILSSSNSGSAVTFSGTVAVFVTYPSDRSVYSNGTNIVPDNAATLLTTSGGTGLSSYTAGDLPYYATGTALSKLTIGASGRWLGSSGTAPQWNAPAALTKTDDTNVTLTLGGSASTSLLNAASLTLGWTGQLATTRGGTGLSSFTANGIVYASSTSALTTSSALTFNGSTLATTGALTVNGNTTLGNATSDTVTVNGYMGVGAAGTANSGNSITIQSAALSGATQIGVYSNITGTSNAITGIDSFYSLPATASATYTAARVSGFYADTAFASGTSTITNTYGVYVADQLYGTNNYGVASAVSSGVGTSWNIYASGTAPNYFAGNVGVGVTAPTCALDVTGGIKTSRTGVTSPATTDGNVFSGTYTPAQVGTNTNVAAVTFSTCQYMRVGAVVTVSGQLAITATTAATDTVVKMTVPVTTLFGASRQLAGAGVAVTTPYAQNSLAFLADTTNESVDVRLRPTVNTALTYNFSFTYLVS